jgi:hypothetical protein
MIVKCVECGKEYEVKFYNKISNLQCDCGGDLRQLTFNEHREEKKNKFDKKSDNQNTGNAYITEWVSKSLGGKYPHRSLGTANLTTDKLVMIQYGPIHHKIDKEIQIRYEDIDKLRLSEQRGLSPDRIIISTKSGTFTIEKQYKSEKLEHFFKILTMNVNLHHKRDI